MAETASPRTSPSPSHLPLSRFVIVAILAISTVLSGLVITSESYWIEEAHSLIGATAPDSGEAWKDAPAVGAPTLQMPLYQSYLYLWHKVIGGDEWSMRASNIPWFILAQLAFLLVLRRSPRLALTACLLALISPPLWIYLSETRPYLMQFAAGCWLSAGLVRLSSEDKTRFSPRLVAALASAAIVLFASSLTGVLWVSAFAMAFAWLIFRQDGLEGMNTAKTWIVLLLSVFFLNTFLIYYVFTLVGFGSGYHGSGASVLSVPYIFYEMLGFSGYGPGRLEMRQNPISTVLSSYATLLPLGLCLLLLAIFALRKGRQRTIRLDAKVAWILALALPAGALVLGFTFLDFRSLPHHFIPALPILLLALASLILLALETKTRFWGAVAISLPVLWLGSSLNLRWQEAHAKDDYRTAAAIAAAALVQNKEVWWAADPAAAFIYLTPVSFEDVPGRVWAMQGADWNDIRFKLPPRVIIISKPDIFDPKQAIIRYAAENHFTPALRLPAFTILTRPDDPLPIALP